MNHITRRPGRNLIVSVLSLLLPAAYAAAEPSPEDVATPQAVKASGGALRSGSSALAAGAALQPGTSYSVAGLQEARVSSASGASFRAMPGARFSLVAAETGRLAVRLEEGVLADADGGTGRIEVVTPAVVVVGERATVFARVLPRGVYVEHQQGSKGTVEVRGRGMQPVTLAPGTFRMLATDAGDAVPAVETSLGAPRQQPGADFGAPRQQPGADFGAPRQQPGPPGPNDPAPAGSPPPGTRTADGAIVVYTAVVPGGPPATGMPRTEGRPVGPQPGVSYGPRAAAAPPCGPVPCAPPPVSCAPPCPPAPSTPAQTPCPGCDQPMRATDVPVPSRPDDAGRPALGHALGQPGCCGSCCTETMCNKIPYVHYVEGLVCDVTTYKVGCSLITVRPASRVRARRLPDGSLELWAPNIGKDLALIEINENQFGYIGEDGFLVLGPCGTIDYFRGLVHLYVRRDRQLTDEGPPKRREVSGQAVNDEVPTKAGR